MLNLAMGEELVRAARRAIKYFAAMAKLPLASSSFPELQKTRSVFVSLRGLDGKLRGCMGFTQTTLPLIDAVGQAAVNAAYADKRFPPLATGELDSVLVEVSVLSAFQQLKGHHDHFPSEINPDVHGLYLERPPFFALLLPAEAQEAKYGARDMLEQLCLRAKLLKTSWKEDKSMISVFSAQEFRELSPEGKVIALNASDLPQSVAGKDTPTDKEETE